MVNFASPSALPQHLRALDQANQVRLARAELKREVGAGSVTVEEVIEDRPWQAETMSLSELLMSQRRWGRMRCRRLLLSIELPENKRLGTLTARQRAVLTAALARGARERSGYGSDHLQAGHKSASSAVSDWATVA